MRRAVLLSLFIITTALAAPHYELTPGKTFLYKQHFIENLPNQSVTIDGTWEVTIIRELEVGWRRIALKKTSNYSLTTKGETKAFPPQIVHLWFDMKPSGEINPGTGVMTGPNLQTIFPRLPDDDAAKTWSGFYPPSGVTTKYTFTADNDFIGEESSAFHTIYERSDNWTFTFDRSRGVIERVASKNSQKFNGPQDGEGEVVLEGENTLPLDELKTWSNELDDFLEVEGQVNLKLREACNARVKGDVAIEDIRVLTTRAAEKATTDFVKQMYPSLEKSTIGQIEQYKRHVAGLRDRPAENWTLDDVDGKEHTLGDLRGKIVVLDFWSRNNAWAIFNMPPITNLAEKFKDKPIVFLAMSVQDSAADAKTFAQICHIDYPVILTNRTIKGFDTRMINATMVIDQAGILRNVFLGTSTTRQQDIDDLLDVLLAKPAAGPTSTP